MMNMAFDSEKYIKRQREEILKRLDKFPRGKLYFEIGGKFLLDEHASRVLPGYDPESKIKILKSFGRNFDIIFCISSPDIEQKRIWKTGETYEETVLKKLIEIKSANLPQPQISVNLYSGEKSTKEFLDKLRKLGYKCYLRFKIDGYPQDTNRILSEEGFGADDYIPTSSNFVVVTGLGSNSGKMSTCLGQIYQDKELGLDSGYAKYETFPIWNLPLSHPVNLAYEAATADIGDFNAIDEFHQKVYQQTSINYNRDIDAYPILANIISKLVDRKNFMRQYKSPTDMGINTAKEAFLDEKEIIEAAITEIKYRQKYYENLARNGKGEKEWVERCQELLEKARKF